MTPRRPHIQTEKRIGRRRLLGSGATLSLGAAAAVLAACGGDGGSTQSTSGSPSAGAAGGASAGTPRRGGRLGWTFLNSPNFNPVINWAEAFWLSGSHVYDRLLTSNEDESRYALEAARSVETPDPQTIVFKLKPNLTTQNLPPVNGRALKAQDVVATQKYVQTVPNAYDANFQRNYMASVDAPDEQTIIFKLKRPNAYVFGSQMLGINTSQVIIPTEMLEKDLNTTPPVGSGPWQLAEHQLDSRYLFKRFDGYRDADKGWPYIDEHELIKLNDPAAIEAAFRSGQIHILTPQAPDADRMVRDFGNKAVLTKKTSAVPVAFWLNMERDFPWQKDQRIRQAFWRAMNREQILALAYAGKGAVPAGLVPAGLTAWQLDAKDTAEYQKHDPREAKQLLDAAGWDYNQSFEITQRDSLVNLQMAEVYQQQMATIGVKLRIQGYQFQDWLPNMMGQRKYHVVLEQSPGDETPGRTMRFQHSTTTNQNSGFSLHDPMIDALIEKSEETLDLQENIKLVKQAQLEALKKYSSSRMILTPDTLMFTDARLQNWAVPSNFSGILKYRADAWFSS